MQIVTATRRSPSALTAWQQPSRTKPRLLRHRRSATCGSNDHRGSASSGSSSSIMNTLQRRLANLNTRYSIPSGRRPTDGEGSPTIVEYACRKVHTAACAAEGCAARRWHHEDGLKRRSAPWALPRCRYVVARPGHRAPVFLRRRTIADNGTVLSTAATATELSSLRRSLLCCSSTSASVCSTFSQQPPLSSSLVLRPQPSYR